MQIIHTYAISLVTALTLMATGSVPTGFDFASCNMHAGDAVRIGSRAASSAVPNPKDRQRADDAQRGGTPKPDDAQLSGIDPEGAKDPAYQAAYRICMRRGGF
jgi:hypothetical protein